jgi:2-polyprenyl-6-methoxyphenol hydroxylase-like FAD-dependent oxidoreductase
MDRNDEIAIIGGSLVGPATELLLRRAGFTNVTTYEAMSQATASSGGVMGLRDTTLRLLKAAQVNTDGLKALESNQVHSFDMINGEPVHRGSSDFPGLTTTWDLLHDALVEPLTINYGKRVTSIELVPGGNAIVSFGDGDEIRPKVIIAADGRRSFVRRQLDPSRTMTYQGYSTWRGMVPSAHTSLGLEGFHRYYDQAHGTLFSLTAPVAPTGHSYWEFSHNLAVEDVSHLLGAVPTERPFLLPHQVTDRHLDYLDAVMRDHLVPDVLRTVVAGRSTEVMLLPVNDLPLPDTAMWHVGNTVVVLIGDALIPARLQVGAGLNMGVKQAAGLVRVLASGQPLRDWQHEAIDEIAPWIELGRSRAHRSNLGHYSPVTPGRTAVPTTDVWSTPMWVPA